MGMTVPSGSNWLAMEISPVVDWGIATLCAAIDSSMLFCRDRGLGGNDGPICVGCCCGFLSYVVHCTSSICLSSEA